MLSLRAFHSRELQLPVLCPTNTLRTFLLTLLLLLLLLTCTLTWLHSRHYQYASSSIVSLLFLCLSQNSALHTGALSSCFLMPNPSLENSNHLLLTGGCSLPGCRSVSAYRGYPVPISQTYGSFRVEHLYLMNNQSSMDPFCLSNVRMLLRFKLRWKDRKPYSH